jgi:hypothetical protein
MLRRGCALTIAIFIGLFIVYLAFFTAYFEWPGNLIAAGFGSLFGGAGVGAIGNLYWSRRDAAAFARTARGEPPQDRMLTAIAGPVRPLGAALDTPFSRVPCVAYEYDVFEEVVTPRGRTSPMPHDLAGFAMAACAIDTPHGAVRLLGFPLLDEFPKKRHEGSHLKDAAQRYVAATAFEPMHQLGGILKMASSMDDALQDADGIVRKDFRIRGDEIPLDRRVITERVVRVGENVVALGLYDAARRALVPRGAVLNRLWPGTAANVQRHVVGTARSQARVGFVFFLISHAALALAFYMSETRHQREPAHEQAAMINAIVERGDIAALERAVHRGADPNARDLLGDVPIMDVRDPVMAVTLIRLGADVNAVDGNDGDTPLIRAARSGDADVVRILLASGANVHVQTSSGVTALGEATGGGHEEVVTLLRLAGAGVHDPIEVSPPELERAPVKKP